MARMIQQYITEFKKPQKEAAAKFGRTEEWVSEYLGYLGFPGEAKAEFAAANLSRDTLRALKGAPQGVQLQIAKELKDSSLKPDGVVKKINQLRFGKKGQGKGTPDPRRVLATLMDQSHEEAGPDPLGEAFAQAKTQEGMLNYGEWAVSYGSYGTLKIPKTELAPSTTGWLFWKENPEAEDAGSNLAQWFEAMAQAVRKKASKPAPATQSPVDTAPHPPLSPEGRGTSSLTPSPLRGEGGGEGEDQEILDPKIAAMIARVKARRGIL
jgi:hypothetical protein